MRGILERVAAGKIPVSKAERLLKITNLTAIEDFARLDLNRDIRKGIPEIVMAEGKEPSQIVKIVEKVLQAKGRVILSRPSKRHLRALNALNNPEAPKKFSTKGLLILKRPNFKTEKTGGRVAILTAGTSDIKVANEAKVIAEEMGCLVRMENDVGVAGIHRVFPSLKRVLALDPDVIIVAAGREGALPTVVAGMVDIPVIGLPVSTGYGAGGRGKTALNAMLQACSLGIAVVNIDSGVAAGAVAALIANRAAKSRRRLTRSTKSA